MSDTHATWTRWAIGIGVSLFVAFVTTLNTTQAALLWHMFDELDQIETRVSETEIRSRIAEAVALERTSDRWTATMELMLLNIENPTAADIKRIQQDFSP